MKNKIKDFWVEHKDTIKNITILVAVPVAVLALVGIKSLNTIIDENNLTELFYGGDEE